MGMKKFASVVAAVCYVTAAAAQVPSPDVEPFPSFDPAQQTMLPPAADDDGSCVCTREYNPMCGKTSDGTTKTFSNECLAMCEKAEIVALGPC